METVRDELRLERRAIEADEVFRRFCPWRQFRVAHRPAGLQEAWVAGGGLVCRRAGFVGFVGGLGAGGRGRVRCVGCVGCMGCMGCVADRKARLRGRRVARGDGFALWVHVRFGVRDVSVGVFWAFGVCERVEWVWSVCDCTWSIWRVLRVRDKFLLVGGPACVAPRCVGGGVRSSLAGNNRV